MPRDLSSALRRKTNVPLARPALSGLGIDSDIYFGDVAYDVSDTSYSPVSTYAPVVGSSSDDSSSWWSDVGMKLLDIGGSYLSSTLTAQQRADAYAAQAKAQTDQYNAAALAAQRQTAILASQTKNLAPGTTIQTAQGNIITRATSTVEDAMKSPLVWVALAAGGYMLFKAMKK